MFVRYHKHATLYKSVGPSVSWFLLQFVCWSVDQVIRRCIEYNLHHCTCSPYANEAVVYTRAVALITSIEDKQ